MPETDNVSSNRISSETPASAPVPEKRAITAKDIKSTMPQSFRPPAPLSRTINARRALPATPTNKVPRALPQTPVETLPAYGKGSHIGSHPAFVKMTREECSKELAGATEGCFLINPRKEGGYWLNIAASDPKKPGSTHVQTFPLERVDKIYRLKSKEKKQSLPSIPI